jgi:hypothetical protein
VATGIESTITVVRFKDGELSEVRIVPIELGGRNLPRPRRGMPRLLDAGEQADRILKRIAKLSERFGTRLAVMPDRAQVDLNGAATAPKTSAKEMASSR